jgi:hypothetical protein
MIHVHIVALMVLFLTYRYSYLQCKSYIALRVTRAPVPYRSVASRCSGSAVIPLLSHKPNFYNSIGHVSNYPRHEILRPPARQAACCEMDGAEVRCVERSHKNVSLAISGVLSYPSRLFAACPEPSDHDNSKRVTMGTRHCCLLDIYPR